MDKEGMIRVYGLGFFLKIWSGIYTCIELIIDVEIPGPTRCINKTYPSFNYIQQPLKITAAFQCKKVPQFPTYCI